MIEIAIVPNSDLFNVVLRNHEKMKAVNYIIRTYCDVAFATTIILTDPVS